MPAKMWCYQRTFQNPFCTQRVNNGREALQHHQQQVILHLLICSSSTKTASNPIWRVWASPAAQSCFPLLYCSLAECKLLTGNAGWKHIPSQSKALGAYMRHTFVWGHEKACPPGKCGKHKILHVTGPCSKYNARELQSTPLDTSFCCFVHGFC